MWDNGITKRKKTDAPAETACRRKLICMLQCHFICCYQSHKINKSWFNQLKRLFIFVCQPTDLCFQMFIQFLPSKLRKKSDDRKGEKYETQEQRNPDIEFLLEINLQEMARGIKVRMVQCTIWIYIYLATVTLRRLFFFKNNPIFDFSFNKKMFRRYRKLLLSLQIAK